MLSHAQRNSLAQLGLGLQLGLITQSLAPALQARAWHQPSRQRIIVSKFGHVTRLTLRSLLHRSSLHQLPTLASGVVDQCCERLDSHLYRNCYGYRGYRWLPAFSSERIFSVCSKLKPLMVLTGSLALIALQMRGHPLVVWGFWGSLVCSVISSHSERFLQVRQNLELASRVFACAANPLPNLALLLVSRVFQELDFRGFQGILNSAAQRLSRCWSAAVDTDVQTA